MTADGDVPPDDRWGRVAWRLTVYIPGDPVPKQRPRLGRGGNVYTPRETRDYEARVKACMKWAAVAARWAVDPKARYAVALDIVQRRGRLGDVDNIEKAIMDAGNRVVWHDDRQIDAKVTTRSVGDAPRVTLRVARWE